MRALLQIRSRPLVLHHGPKEGSWERHKILDTYPCKLFYVLDPYWTPERLLEQFPPVPNVRLQRGMCTTQDLMQEQHDDLFKDPLRYDSEVDHEEVWTQSMRAQSHMPVASLSTEEHELIHGRRCGIAMKECLSWEWSLSEQDRMLASATLRKLIRSSFRPKVAWLHVKLMFQSSMQKRIKGLRSARECGGLVPSPMNVLKQADMDATVSTIIDMPQPEAVEEEPEFDVPVAVPRFRHGSG